MGELDQLPYIFLDQPSPLRMQRTENSAGSSAPPEVGAAGDDGVIETAPESSTGASTVQRRPSSREPRAEGDPLPVPIHLSDAGEVARERIERAIRVIDAGAEPRAAAELGEWLNAQRQSDHLIEPLAHARIYAAIAPELARRLRASDVRVTAECYTDRDARACEMRDELGRLSELARAAVLSAGISAALLVAVAGLAAVPAVSVSQLRVGVLALSLVAVVSSAVAAGLIHRIRGGSLHDRWMKRRAEAEAERLRYFSLLVDGPPLGEPLLQLEYLRRFQLDVQRRFFRQRGDDQRRRAERRFSLVAATMVAAGIATGVAGVLGASVSTAFTSLAALALVAQAFGARAENQEAAEQSGRHAERYEQTAVALDRLYARLDEVREATATLAPGEDPEAMRAFAAAAHDILGAEHREWLDETREARVALEGLERLLADAARSRGSGAEPSSPVQSEPGAADG